MSESDSDDSEAGGAHIRGHVVVHADRAAAYEHEEKDSERFGQTSLGDTCFHTNNTIF